MEEHVVKPSKQILSWFFMLLLFCWSMNAQQTPSLTGSATVPRLVNFSGKTTDPQGKAISGVAGVTFAIYKEQYEGAPLWLETQNVQADARGNYTSQLGATRTRRFAARSFQLRQRSLAGCTSKRTTRAAACIAA
jgi:hypothetical protein